MRTMRGMLLLLVVAAGVARAAEPPARATTAPPEDAVRQAETARAQALLKADTTTLARLLADEFIETSRLGQIRDRTQNLRDVGSGTLHFQAIRFDSLVVRIYGGTIAVVRGIVDNTGAFAGMPFGGRGRYTRVYVLRDGRWQAVASQTTMMAAP